MENTEKQKETRSGEIGKIRTRKTKVKYIKKKGFLLDRHKIPLDKLLNAKEIINKADHAVWYNRNTSCMPGIHAFKQTAPCPQADLMVKIFYAKQCLLRRDWKNFAKIIALSNPNGIKRYNDFFSLVSKYAAIFLAYVDPGQLDTFIQSLLNSLQYDANGLVRLCSKHPAQNSFSLKE